MGSKPITYRSKSPLKIGGVGLLGKKKVVDADGNVLSADDSGKKTPGSPPVPEVRKTVLYSDLPEDQRQAAREYNMKKFGTHNPTAEGKADNTVVTQAAQPATEGSFDRETEYKPELTEGRDADKVDTFYPWEARFARRTQRASVRDEKRRGRQAERNLNRALNKGVIDQDEYDAEIGNAQRMRYGQGNIAQRQIGIDGGIEGTEGFDAITSQGYQANRRNTLRTDMDRRPQGEQKAGMPVKADGTEDMTQEEYEAGGKGKSTPKTSKAVQDASSNAGASVTEDQAKQESGESTNLSTADPSVDQKFPYQYKHINKIKKYKDIPEIGEPKGAELVQINKPDTRPSSSDMFGGLSTVELADLSEALTDQQNQATNEANEFTGESVQANTGTGNRSNMVSFEPTAREKAEKTIEAPGSDLPKINESYVENTEDVISAEADAMLTEDMKNSRSAFKMRRTHNSRTMYGESPAKMWGPSKKASAGKTTGAQNIDSSTPGRPVTQNVTRSAKGIVTGKLNQSSGFKMKGFGNGKK